MKALIDSLKIESACSAAEWETRCELAALYRIAHRLGMSDVIYTHISARVPGTHDEFLINSFGSLFDRMTASSLVKVDHRGNIITPLAGEAPPDINFAGFVIHSAAHMARPEVNFVLHAHTPAGMAVAAHKDGLLPITQHAMMFYGRTGYHAYEGFASETDERARIAADLGHHDVLILRNHGTLILGTTVGEVLHRAYHLDRACQAQVMALGAGQENLTIPMAEVAAQTGRFATHIPVRHYELFWAASLAELDAPDASYRC